VETRGPCVSASQNAILDGIEIGGRPSKTQVVGTVVFTFCQHYSSRKEFEDDSLNHRILAGGSQDWRDKKPRFAWHIGSVRRLVEPISVRTGQTGFGYRNFDVIFATPFQSHASS